MNLAGHQATAAMATHRATVVLYPSLAVGHLNPMLELAKLFLRRGVAVVIAVAADAATTERLAAANPPGITFRHLLPAAAPPRGLTDDDGSSHPIMRTLGTLHAAKPALRALLRRALPAVDMFCADALDAAAELGVPGYLFFTSALGDLAVMLHLPHTLRAMARPLKDVPDAVLRFPGVPPVRAMDISANVQDGGSEIAVALLEQCARMPEATGFLVNTFDWLEARALAAFRSGAYTPPAGGRSSPPPPPVYCVGPLVVVPPGKNCGERHACVAWLDAQPSRSVVFLCFGSMGVFPAAQLREIALGLENSGHRFLWVVRSPSVSNEQQQDRSMELKDLEALLPLGFLERTRERGLVVGNWAPQMEVLRHDAVGAFVTHCGWNSALEGISSGVPMICWPLYAEQRTNKVLMVEEMRVGVAVEGYEKEVVTAEEVEAKVRLVMESGEGRKLRERLLVAKEMAVDALREGGSSDMAFNKFLEDLEKLSTGHIED